MKTTKNKLSITLISAMILMILANVVICKSLKLSVDRESRIKERYKFV